ncbi:MAG TPA: SpoIID/LytB domain-containing protein [Actinomycetota bacterium]
MARPRLSSAAILVCVLLAQAPPAAAQQQPPRRVRVAVPDGSSVLVHGDYPPIQSSCVDPVQPVLHERYRGAVEVLRADDGSLTVLGELGFEDYLKGIAEVPRSWPEEALKAQVVAARSYAASRLDPGGEYDLCATDACQVYMGMGVESGAFGRRWAEAVEATAGRILLFQGRPAQTFYSSTSNGRTYTNAEVWGGDPLPYLPSQPERDDGESPVSRWRVEVPFADLERLLRADGRWSGGGLRRVRVEQGAVLLRGRRLGARLSKAELRDALNDTARCLLPDRYPPTEPDGTRLPMTVPSTWFRMRTEGRALVLEGRGWGHGVGMVQWGAKGKADRGLSYEEILAHYYGGLRPQSYDLPGSIRVLLATGLTSVTVEPAGEARIAIRGVGSPPSPPLRVTPTPRGIRVTTSAPPAPRLEIMRFGIRPRAGGGIRATLVTESAVKVRAEFLQDDGIVRSRWRSLEAGQVRFRLPAPVPAGPTQVRLRVTDGVDAIVTGTRAVLVEGSATVGPSPSPSATGAEVSAPRPEPDDQGPSVLLMLGLAAGAALVLGLVLTRSRRRGLHRR